MNARPAVDAVDCLQVGRAGRYSRQLGLALGITLAFMLVEVVGGWLANSLALLADAGHMLGDAASLALALLAARLAQQPATPARTYGYLRLEIFAAVANGVVLVGVAVLILWQAVVRLGAPPEIRSGTMLAVAVAGLGANLVALRVLHAGHRHSLNVRGAYLHVLGDLLGSIGTIVAGLVILFTGWVAADAVVSAVIALLVAASAVRLLRESVDVLLEATPRHIALDEVAAELVALDGVSDVHDLHVWTLTSGVVAMTGHAVLDDPDRRGDVLGAAAARMRRMGIQHVTIQLETEGRCPEAAAP